MCDNEIFAGTGVLILQIILLNHRKEMIFVIISDGNSGFANNDPVTLDGVDLVEGYNV